LLAFFVSVIEFRHRSVMSKV